MQWGEGFPLHSCFMRWPVFRLRLHEWCKMDQLHVLIMSKCLSGLNSIHYGRQGTHAFHCILYEAQGSHRSIFWIPTQLSALLFYHQFQSGIKFVANAVQNIQYFRVILLAMCFLVKVDSVCPLNQFVSSSSHHPTSPLFLHPVLQSWAKLWAWFTIIGFRLFINTLELSSMH